MASRLCAVVPRVIPHAPAIHLINVPFAEAIISLLDALLLLTDLFACYLRTSGNTQSVRGHGPDFPFILYWNVNGFRARLPDFRVRVFESIAFEESHTPPGECRISNYSSHQSKKYRTNGRSTASLYVCASIHQMAVNLKIYVRMMPSIPVLVSALAVF